LPVQCLAANYDAQMGEHQSGKLSGTRGQIYVEIGIRTSMERLWTLSQDPDLHRRWDLRFSRIIPTDSTAGGLISFRYEFRLPFHTIKGTGTSLGHRLRADGQATSVLKFSTADALSPIGQGSGYWRYIPADEGVRFITGNYWPGMGMLGKILDGRVIRPALGWATAISFDRLRLWAESDLDPKETRNRWIMDAAARLSGIMAAVLLLRQAFTGQGAGRPPPWESLRHWPHGFSRRTGRYRGPGGVCGRSLGLFGSPSRGVVDGSVSASRGVPQYSVPRPGRERSVHDRELPLR
jgi:hypothetical protein